MQITHKLRAQVARWPYAMVSLMAALASFGAYTSMYAFRKAFTAGTFASEQYLHVDYKVWLVIAQIFGYMFSKFYGIRFIAEIKGKRGITIIVLVVISWMALLGFALVPAPYNIAFLFINGFPLGLIWGLVFGYLEGRRSTEFMAAVLSISFIFGSGFVKTVGQTLMQVYGVSEYNMPFLTGALFILPLIIFVFLLELMPPQTQEDKLLRTERLPMNGEERKKFLMRFLPGIILTAVVYVLLTVMRDIRDNFNVEIWNSLGITDRSIYARIDTRISVIVLVAMSLLILVKRNLRAFSLIHLMIIAGCILVGVSTVMFTLNMISPVSWMTMAGLGLYLGYVPYNAIFFERMIATFHYKSNAGFLIYVADSVGYLGSVSVLLIKEFVRPGIGWSMFFKDGLMVVAFIGSVCGLFSLIYFLRSARKKQLSDQSLKLSAV
jgi:MFS family permease